jgi:hypothetical protein
MLILSVVKPSVVKLSVVMPSVVKLTVAASKRGNLSKKSPMNYDSNVNGINRFYAALMHTEWTHFLARDIPKGTFRLLILRLRVSIDTTTILIMTTNHRDRSKPRERTLKRIM